jgi:hypothetical protein
MSDQLRALGIDLIEGFGADQTGAQTRRLRGGKRGQPSSRKPEGMPEVPADGGDSGRRLAVTPAVRSGWPSTSCKTVMSLAVAGTHGKDHHDGHADLDSGIAQACNPVSWWVAYR